MENLILTEKIDRYLASAMSEEEMLQFEEKLKSDKHLQREVNIQREAIKAIRQKAMREKVQRFERQMRVQTIRRWTIRTLSPIAIAACFAGVIIWTQLTRVTSLSNDSDLYASLNSDITEAYSSLKGSDDITDLILAANDLMAEGKYEMADKILTEGLSQLGTVTKEYEQEWFAKEDMLYMRALCAIKQHKLYRSRILLSQVIEMDASHKADAEKLLKQIKGH